MNQTTSRLLLRDIAEIIDRATGEGVGFAFFLESGGDWSYASNGHRADVVKTLAEWIERTRTTDESGPGEEPIEAAPDRAKRVALEERCADIGRTIAGAGTGVALFLFDFGPKGNLAYFTNVRGARERVTSWVNEQRGLS
jgi:hypothetical protein